MEVTGEVHLAQRFTISTIESSTQLASPLQQRVSSPGLHSGSSGSAGSCGTQISAPGSVSSFEGEGHSNQSGTGNDSGNMLFRVSIAGSTLWRMQTLPRVLWSATEIWGLSRGTTSLPAFALSSLYSSSNPAEISIRSSSRLMARSWLSRRLGVVAKMLSVAKVRSSWELSLLRTFIPFENSLMGVGRRNKSSDRNTGKAS